MTDIVAKLWGFCHTLRHDGIGYSHYVEQLTYLLFLKMAGEKALSLPKKTDWTYLRALSGTELLDAYVEALRLLGKQPGLLGDIFSGAQSRFSNPVNLRKLIGLIDETEWTELGVDVKAAAFEGLLEKAASEGKKGAGQYFTPRLLIKAIVRCMKPDPRVSRDFRIDDPACGTGGFLVSSYEWLLEQTKGSLERDVAKRIRTQTYFGQDIDPEPRRLAVMNLYLHQVEPHIERKDSISETPDPNRFDVVLTNPPFGTKGANQAPDRDDFTISTSNKQLNFLQHVLTILKPGGRAAVVVPDNVLFADQAGDVFRVLTEDCDLHTVLRCPRGTFTPYSPGTKTNVIFFTKGRRTERTWVFDARANVPAITKKSRPLSAAHFAEFELCFGPDPNGHGKRRGEDSATGRWRAFAIEEIAKRHYKLDSFKWIRDETAEDDDVREPEELVTDALENLRLALDALNNIHNVVELSASGEESELPDGWTTVPLEVLARPGSIAYGVLKPGPNTPGGTPMLRVKDIQSGTVDREGVYQISAGLDSAFRRTKLEGGEVVLSIQGSVGRAALVPSALRGANVSRTLAVIRPLVPELGSWIWLWLQSPQAQAAMRDVVGGTTRDSLNLRDLRQLEIPVAPLQEQSRIAERVRQLLDGASAIVARIDDARQAIADRPADGPTDRDRLKRAILAKAFRGALVATEAEVAAQNGRDFESATELIRRLQPVPRIAKSSVHGGRGTSGSPRRDAETNQKKSKTTTTRRASRAGSDNQSARVIGGRT